ncbi:MAG: hypothetical protein ACRDZX_11090 [Acidimicrobiales bacterium]
MKWHILLEVRLQGEPEDVEAVLDNLMEHLVDAGIEDPAVGASLQMGTVEIEFVVDGAVLEEAHRRSRNILAGALMLPPNSELVGESTRRVEFVPA